MAADDIDLSGTRVAGMGSTDPAAKGASGGGGEGDDGRSAGTYVSLILGVVAIGLLVLWVARNRRTVPVDWLFGTTSAPLAVTIFIAAALGWVAGLATVPLVRRRRRRTKAD